MILAEKIATLRKKQGWSQEALAAKLGVSRQAISKWESAQATPDLDRILAMSDIFSVSTDFLMKDSLELAEPAPGSSAHDSLARRVSLDDATRFVAAKRSAAKIIAVGTALCIVSPTALIALTSLQEAGRIALSEAAATFIGVALLLVLVGTGVALFITAGAKTREFRFMESEMIDTEYGVGGYAKKERAAFASKRLVSIVAGMSLIFLAAIGLTGSGILEDELGPVAAVGVALMLVPIAIGVSFLVHSGVIDGAFKQLLQEDDYTPQTKSTEKKVGPIFGIYWLVVVALFLAYSLATNDWERSWIMWPVAGVLGGVLAIVLKMVFTKDGSADAKGER